MKKTILIFFLYLIAESLVAQPENYNWVFGNKAWMDFSSGSYIFKTGSLMDARYEGVASHSDKFGNLLFYSEGSIVWRVNNGVHSVMPNGTGLMGNASATQGCVIIPNPTQSNIYYLFTSDYYGGTNGVRVTTIDKNLSGGLGDVVITPSFPYETAKNTLLLNSTSEKIIAITKSCSDTTWVISIKDNTNPIEYHAYTVTSDGVSFTPIISTGLADLTTGVTGPGYGYGMPGYLKFSPDQTKLANILTFKGQVEFLDFNFQTGQLSNPVLHTDQFGGFNVYSGEFSPDSKVFYYTFSQQANSGLHQLDLTTMTQSFIYPSPNPTATEFGGMNLGIDGKIYMVISKISNGTGTTMSVINDPNVLGAGCNFQYNTITLPSGMNTHRGLPNFIAGSARINVDLWNDTGICAGSQLTLNTGYTGYPHEWSTGSTSESITVSNSGLYTAIIEEPNGCELSAEIYVTVNPIPTPTFSTSDYCQNQLHSVTAISPTGGVFSLISNPTGATINPLTGIIDNGIGGNSYTIQYSLTQNGCTGIISKVVNVLSTPVPNFIADDFCADVVNTFDMTGASLGGVYSFTPIPTDGAVINSSTGVITNAVAGNSYFVEYSFANCAVSFIDQANALQRSDATFIILDFCAGTPSTPQVVQTGGVFSFNTPPGDGAIIDANTGILSNYTVGATYDIKYTLSGICPDSKTDLVTVLNQPSAAFVFDDYCEGTNGLPQITGTAGGVFSFNPIPTDGATIDVVTGALANTVNGTQYTVEYSFGGSCNASQTDAITVLAVPNATFTIADFCAGGSNTVQATQSGGSFSFNTLPGDGAILDATSGALSNYTTGTTYDIKYTIVAGICSDSKTDQVTVLNQPSAAFVFDDYCEGTNGLPQITGTAGGVFSFNPIPTDGATIDVVTGALANTVNGTQYTVEYSFGGSCNASQTDAITVLAVPNATFTIADFCAGGSNTVQATQSGGSFSFNTLPGDGAILDATSGALSNYTTGTTYDIKYTIVAGICSDSKTDQVTVLSQPSAAFVFDDYCEGTNGLPQITGTAGGVFSFNPIPTDGATIDAVTGALANTVNGTQYTVEYSFGGSCNASQTDAVTVIVNADATFTIADFCDGGVNTVQTNQAGGVFSFNTAPLDAALIDANTGVLSNYTAGTTYDIKYTIAGFCGDSKTDQVTVLSQPSAAFVVNDYCYGNSMIPQITGTSQGFFSFQSLPSDGAQINAGTGELSMITEGSTYYIKYAFGGSCPTFSVQPVHIFYLPQVDFSFDHLCEVDIVEFQDLSTVNGGNLVQWNWTFDNTGNSILQNPSEDLPVGIHEAKLQVIDNHGCEGSKTENLEVYPSPVALFSSTDVCENNGNMTFTDQSTGTISSWYWDFGNNLTSSNQHPTHEYTTAGSFAVSLEVTTADGCKASIAKNVTVHPKPIGTIKIGKLNACGSLCTTLSFESTQNIINWNWEVDNQIKEDQNTEICLANPGKYPVNITVSNQFGCVESFQAIDTLEVYAIPVAGFSTDKEIYVLLKANVILVDSSSGANTWLWNFGDESESTEQSPTHQFYDTGSFDIRQIVISKDGCSDTSLKSIRIIPEFHLYVPNAFTPGDGDGINDGFRAQGMGILKEGYQMLIFNRWGDLVFTGHNLEETWNGNDLKNELAKQDVYSYKIQAIELSGKLHVLTGSVTLIR